MSPGTYLRKRREAAGVSLDLAAVALVPWAQAKKVFEPAAVRSVINNDLVAQVVHVSAWIAELERDMRVVDGAVTARLACIIPLDVEIYDRLVAHKHGVAVPLPQICRECGCSWHHPCVQRVESGIPGCFAEYGCAWAGADPNLCTACERKAATPQQETADAS
ncbi:hypothetical protein IP68_02315 [Blastomonas sp. AAP25]|uniref:hypothetical protein n=1 Tax=Blastomonas sp. AAP25 TaxID=1523416 RepID=UPI0006B8F9C7|nr:hypothetical protein [Blastomonas sp. AAP25]KPF76749.1 hypothetical protein IP68_02315 [Blastomonas sp. AAP25]